MVSIQIGRRSSHYLSVAAMRLLQGFTEGFNVMRTRDFGAGLVSRELRASDLTSTSTLLLVEAADPMSVIFVCVSAKHKQGDAWKTSRCDRKK